MATTAESTRALPFAALDLTTMPMCILIQYIPAMCGLQAHDACEWFSARPRNRSHSVPRARPARQRRASHHHHHHAPSPPAPPSTPLTLTRPSPLPYAPLPPPHTHTTAGGRASVGQRANNYIEELSLGPGVERTLRVRYCPAPPAFDSAGAAGAGDDDDDDDDNDNAEAAPACAAGALARRSAAPVSSQERGGRRCGGAATVADRRGTKLAKQAFKLYFSCQEPRGQWDDGKSGVGG